MQIYLDQIHNQHQAQRKQKQKRLNQQGGDEGDHPKRRVNHQKKLKENLSGLEA
jgi:hypothetical protein